MIRRFHAWLAALFLCCQLAAQEVVIDVGETVALTPDTVALSHTWSLDGTPTGQSTRSLEWTPTRKDTGCHWFKVEMTLPGGAKTAQHWRVRARIPIPASTISYYVATTGSDSQSGDIQAPFATLEKARDTIRALPRPIPVGGVTVFIRGGTYRRSSTFQLASTDSGTAEAPIRYACYGSESPVFTTARIVPAAAFTELDAAMHSRVAAGVTVANIKQLDLTGQSFTYDGPFPTRFNQNRLYNPYLTSQDGGLFEVFCNGGHSPLSRYPNDNLADRFATPCLKMDGVTQKFATTLNGQAIGGQFQYKTTDESRISRWQTAAAEGGLWIQGFFRVPWEEYGMKVKAIDTTANTITLASGASLSLGLGNKYYAYEGSKSEPYWALNLLEEIDQPGEWAVDFIRKRLYLWPSTPINDSNLEISDFGSPVIKLTNTRHVFLQGLEFRRSLAQGIVISGGENNTVVDCAFRQLGSYAVDLENGVSNGVVSCDISDMAAGGIYVRGGDGTTTPRTPCNHFVVNNDIQDIANVCKIYAAGIDAGFGGQAGTGGGGGYKPCVGTRVANNRIAYTHHVGILHGSLEKTIEYNLIDNYCRTNGDMGGIYSFTGLGGDDTIRYNQMTNKAYAWETYFPNYSIGGSGLQFDLECAGSKMFGNIMETIRTGISCNVGTGAAFENNLIVNNRKAATSIGGTPAVFRTNAAALGKTTFGGTTTGTNKTYSTDPGFINRSGNDYRLKPTSPIYQDLPLFREIPVEMIGLYKDETRSGSTNRKPVIDQPAGAGNITQTTASLTAQLDFPFINRDSTVRVYWGTSDGSTTATNWQNQINLGFQTRGTLEVPVSGLTQKTKYHYRFYASNSAGGTWATSTRSFTTAGPPSTKANNTSDLSSASSWANATVPTGGLAVWDRTVTADQQVSIGTGISLLGIQLADPGGNVAISPGSAGSLSLGSGGLDLSSSEKTLAISAPVVLSGDQTWTTGSSGAAGSSQITVSGNVSGAAELRIAGTSGRGIALTGTNTFSGGLVLDASGRVVTGTTPATTTSSALGIGPLTMHGGVIGTAAAFALNSGIANPQIFVHGDFTLAPAGRIMIAGAWDLGGGTRTVSCTRVLNSGSAIQSGSNTSWGLGTVASMSSVVANGNLRVARDASLSSNFVSFRLHNSPAFADNAGLTIGPGVICVLATPLTQSDPTKLADLTVESGGYFALCEDSTANHATIGALSGNGQVGNFCRSTSATTATLTIDGGERDDASEFTGSIVDTNPALSSLATLGKLSLVKSGSTTQTLAGTNSYSGSTIVSEGTLDVTGAITHSSSVSVYSTGRLTGNGSIASPASFNGVLEPTGNLRFQGSLTLTAMSRCNWNLASNSLTGAPVVTAETATIQPGATLHVEMTESAGSVSFTHPFWSSTRVFPLLTANSISGNFTIDSISADSAGNSHETYGSFSVENSGTAINLVWQPSRSGSSTVISRVHPWVVPAATVDLNHALRVAATTAGAETMNWSWSLISGPGMASFRDPTAADTWVTFSAPGRHVIRATASDATSVGFIDIPVDSAAPASVTLRQGVGGYSHPATMIRADNPAWNSGARDQMIVGKTGSALRALLSFDVSSIPRTWPVTSVSLDLWTYPSAGSGSIGTLHLRRLTRTFIEGSGDGSSSTNGLGTGASWDFHNLTGKWTTPGGDFEPTALATLAGYNATATSTLRSFGPTTSLLDALNTSLSGNTSFDLVVLAPTTETDATTNLYTRFASDDHPTEALRPRLNVFFTHDFTPTVHPGPAPTPSVGIPANLDGTVSNATEITWRKLSGPGPVTFADPASPTTTATFSQPGDYRIALCAANPNGESSRMLTISIPANFDAWRQLHFGSTTNAGNAADLADPDADGLPNLVEFATGTSPNTPGGTATSLKLVSQTNDSGSLDFTYPRSHAAVADGIAFIVEWSDSLGSDWTSSAVSQQPIPESDNGSVQLWRASIPAAPASRRFVHLKIVKP